MEREGQRTTVPVIDTEADADADAGTASQSSSTSLGGRKYEVFLSFKDLDTRNFTDFLYTFLIDKGVHTFRDDSELLKGEKMSTELLKAIRESKILIPIISKNYAFSEWCLMELKLMMEYYSSEEKWILPTSEKKKKKLILPIFYDVEPSKVEEQSGPYGVAIKKHERSGSFSEQTIEQWRKALCDVAGLKGWHLETEADGNQGQLIREKIVPKVLSVLKKRVVDVTKNLVGMDHHKNEMMRLLDIDSDDVQIVGIYGMGGIGKTTFAKFMYNKLLKDNFDCCSFLENVQEMGKTPQGLVCLQKKLLVDTLNWIHETITHKDYGKAIIEERFHNKKVLLVLDDVDSKSQFHYLVGKGCNFGEGSKIIVTTKNKGVLNDLKIQCTYELPFMNDAQSLQLFSKHAFGVEFPPKEYVTISKKIASVAGGLPLALESMGSSLCEERDLEIWEAESKKFAETPSCDVWKKLRVDYEALNEKQREIFLDVACLFAGMNKTIVFYFWEDCKYYPEIAFNDLYLRSLVKVGDADELLMHNQLIALGKKIVNDQKDLRNRSRLWNFEGDLTLLQQKRGTEQVEVEALCLGFKLESEENPCFRSEEFIGLIDLRYLRVDGADLIGDFNRVLLSLRWLSWHGCPPDFKPTNFRLKNLVILDLSNSGITEEWGGWKQIQMTKKLKVLLVVDCALRRTPHFSLDAPLEMLILGCCKSLENIDPSIGNLKKLKVLDISHTNIRKLPDEIWMLKKLEVMDLRACSKLEADFSSDMERLSSLRHLSFDDSKIQILLASISGLTQLQTLNIEGCTELESLPDAPSSSKIQTLQELSLPGCPKLVKMPIVTGKLSNLMKLTLRHSNIRSLPEDVGLVSQLKVLHIQSCQDLQCILGLPSSLVVLYLASCNSLKTLPDLSNLKSLSSMFLMNCDKLARVEGLGKLESLTSLYIYSCNMLGTSANYLSNLKKLEKLYIRNCSGLNKIQGLDGLESLKYLDLSDCKNLCKIEDFSNLKKLRTLSIRNCSGLDKIQGLDGLESLKYLDLSDCKNLCTIEDFSNLKKLRTLSIRNCSGLDKIQGLNGLESLEYLDLRNCKNLLEFKDLSNLKKLEKFSISNCPGLLPNLGLSSFNHIASSDDPFDGADHFIKREEFQY